MTVKDEVLALFEKHRGEYLSGEEIAKQLFVSRNSVWKAVKALQAEGYEIAATTNRGYCLSEQNDILSQAGIMRFLGSNPEGISIEVVKEIDSTNASLKALAHNGAPEGTVLIADHQTGGRGRFRRPFFSPPNCGIYMSVLFRPQIDAFDSVMLTTATAVCVAQAVEAVSGRQAAIKWVNDIFLDGKKICGILTEASFGMELGRLDYVVVGMGINVLQPEGGFPEELRSVAGSVFAQAEKNVRNRLAAEILTRLMQSYRSLNDKSYVEEYKKRCFVLGREITVLEGDRSWRATAVGLDDRCRLEVVDAEGAHRLLSSGEISIKM